MFKADDLHPEHGKYRHIVVPADAKSVKVKFKDGEQDEEAKPVKKNPLSFRRYRDDGAA